MKLIIDFLFFLIGIETIMNQITILFFATLRDRAGTSKISFDIPEDMRVVDLKSLLRDEFPDLRTSLESVLVSVEHEFAFDDEIIPNGAEVAFFPPVSGGVDPPTIFAIVEDEVDVNMLLTQITLPTTGAACFFTGMVRAITRRGEPHDTQYLEYEAYKPMAEAKMSQVADEIRDRWPSIEGIAIVQRVGRLDPGTPTVLIACTAPHRDTGVFEAARYGIDRLKEIVPVWKKEVGPHGETWVEGSYSPNTLD